MSNEGADSVADAALDSYNVQDRSITLSDGKYTVKNLKTGQFLAFVREQTTNIIPVDFTSTVDVQKMNNGHIISGGNQECLSAQFSRNVGGGADNAGVAYACESA